MELVGIDNSKVIHLTQLYRPAGQLFQAEAAIKIAQRYSFAQMPSIDDLSKNERSFKLGKFNDFQITEMGVYSDGFIVASATDTDLIDEFIDDILAWSKNEFGLIEPPGTKNERSYESYLVVKSQTDLAKAFAPRNDLAALANKIFRPERYSGTGLQPTGFMLEVDHTQYPARRKPLNLIVDRRLGQSFDENLFFAQGPLRTKDYLKFLRDLEALALAH